MNYRKFIICITGWYFTSITLAVYNKWMFSPIGQGLGVEYPILLTSIHQLSLWLLSLIYIKIRDRRKYYERLAFQENNIQLDTFNNGENRNDDNSTISGNGNNNNSNNGSSNNSSLNAIRNNDKPKSDWKFYFKFILPTAIATAGDIGLSNLSFKFIPLTIYTIIKSSSIAFVLLFSCIFKLEKFRWRLTGIVSVMFIGVILMVYKPSHSHNNKINDTIAEIDEDEETKKILIGSFLVLGSSCLSGLRWVYTQLILKKHDENHANEQALNNRVSNENDFFANINSDDLENQSNIDLSNDNNNDRRINKIDSNEKIKKPHPIYTINQLAPIMFLTLFITSLFIEKSVPNFLNSNLFKILDNKNDSIHNENGNIDNSDTTIISILYGIMLMLIPGIMVFTMTISEFGILQITKVLTLSIAGIVKEVLTIMFGIILLNERISGFYNVMGMTIVLSDVCYYNYYRYKENVKKHSAENVGDGINGNYVALSNEDEGADDDKHGNNHNNDDNNNNYSNNFGGGNNSADNYLKENSHLNDNDMKKYEDDNSYDMTDSGLLNSGTPISKEKTEKAGTNMNNGAPSYLSDENNDEELLIEEKRPSRLNSVEMEIIFRDDNNNHSNNGINKENTDKNREENNKGNEINENNGDRDKYDKYSSNKRTGRKRNDGNKNINRNEKRDFKAIEIDPFTLVADQAVQEYQWNKLGNKLNKSL